VVRDFLGAENILGAHQDRLALIAQAGGLSYSGKKNLVVFNPELVVAVHHENTGEHQNYRQERDYHKLETVDVLQDFFFDHCTDHFLPHIIPDKRHERACKKHHVKEN